MAKPNFWLDGVRFPLGHGRRPLPHLGVRDRVPGFLKVCYRSSMTVSLAFSRQFGSYNGGYGSCCPLVFDPYTLLALGAGVALATYFLRLVVVTTTFNGRSFDDSWPSLSPIAFLGMR